MGKRKDRLTIVVLAAGEGTRMKSDLPKVLHPLAGQPMLAWVLDAAGSVGRPAGRLAVIGRGRDEVGRLLEERGWRPVLQAERLGTGHALARTLPLLGKGEGDVLVLNGDTPLVTAAALRRLLAAHRRSGSVMTLLTSRPADPTGYGRVVRGAGGVFKAIVEEKELPRGAGLGEINAGFYAFRASFLRRELPRLKRHKKSGEYYLTDLAAAAARRGMLTRAVALDDPEEALGVNSRRQLALAGAVLRRRLLERLMDGGVTVTDPERTYVEAGVSVGRDTVLLPGVSLAGRTRVGRRCRIGPWARVEDSVLGDGVVIRDGSVVEGSTVRAGAVVGPMAHVRPGSDIGREARVGNFVEIKKSLLGDGVKAAHLTYLGDAEVGKGANIGAGTVTCNYDGRLKHRTVIGEGAFIGSDVMLVAPVRIGRRAVVGAGSTITRDVPDGALGLSRAPQVIREGWTTFRRALGGGKKK